MAGHGAMRVAAECVLGRRGPAQIIRAQLGGGVGARTSGAAGGMLSKLWPPQPKHMNRWLGVIAIALLGVIRLIRSQKSKEHMENELRRKLKCFGDITKLLFIERQRVAKIEVNRAFEAKDPKALSTAIAEAQAASVELGDGAKQLLELGLGADINSVVDEAIGLAADDGLPALQSLLPVAKTATTPDVLIQKIIALAAVNTQQVGKGLTAEQFTKFQKEAREALKDGLESTTPDKANDSPAAKPEAKPSAEELREKAAEGRPSAASIFQTLYDDAERVTIHDFLLTGQQIPKADSAGAGAKLARSSTKTMAEATSMYSEAEITAVLDAATKMFAEGLTYELESGHMQTAFFFNEVNGNRQSPTEKTVRGIKVNPEYRSGVKIKEICALAEKAHKELGVETREMRATKEALEGLGPLLKHVNKEHGSAWSKLFSILLRDKAQITVVFVISVLCGLPSALTTKLQTTAAQMSITGKESLFASAILGIMVTAFVDFLVQTGARVPREMISIKFKANLKEEVFKAVMRQDTEYFDKFSSAEILQRINEDTNTFADQAMTLPFDILQNASLAACNFVAMYTMVPRQLFMVAMPLIICAGFLKYKILTVVVRQLMNAGNVRRVTDTRVGELLSAKALQTIRSFGKESEEVSRNRRDLSRCAELDMAAQKKLQAFFSVFVPLDSGLGCIILGVGGRLVKQGILDPIALNQTIGMMLLLGFRVFIILDMYSKLGTAMEPAARISELLNARNKLETATWCEQPETERTTFRPNADECTALITCGEEPNGDIRGEIEFKEVDFYYPTRPEIKVLDKLSWKCAQGDHIAFCGKTGCGKSTSIALIQRFYEIAAGQVLIDGKPINHYDLNFLRSQIGMVGQEPILFAKSIRENLLYGCKGSADEAALTAACVKANAWEFIMKLPQKLDTLVGAGGMQLSGGQKQRVAIARAVLQDPKILLLDEATSALDNKSEGVVQEALDELMKGRTSFTVAHRLSTIKDSTCIYLVDSGKLVEKGTYDELVANGGEFTALAAAGGDDTAASVGKDAEQEEVTKKELKKKLHKVLDTLRSEGGDVEKTEMEKMAKQLLGMVATVDREREHLRQTAEAYAKLAGENVDLLGKDGESGTRLTLRTTAKMVMKLGAASKLTAGTSKAEDDEIEKQLSRQITKETDQAGVLSA